MARFSITLKWQNWSPGADSGIDLLMLHYDPYGAFTLNVKSVLNENLGGIFDATHVKWVIV